MSMSNWVTFGKQNGISLPSLTAVTPIVQPVSSSRGLEKGATYGLLYALIGRDQLAGFTIGQGSQPVFVTPVERKQAARVLIKNSDLPSGAGYAAGAALFMRKNSTDYQLMAVRHFPPDRDLEIVVTADLRGAGMFESLQNLQSSVSSNWFGHRNPTGYTPIRGQFEPISMKAGPDAPNIAIQVDKGLAEEVRQLLGEPQNGIVPMTIETGGMTRFVLDMKIVEVTDKGIVRAQMELRDSLMANELPNVAIYPTN